MCHSESPRARGVGSSSRRPVGWIAYTFCALEALRDGLHHCGVFVTRSDRWGHPRSVLLDEHAWEICRKETRTSLGLPKTPQAFVATLARQQCSSRSSSRARSSSACRRCTSSGASERAPGHRPIRSSPPATLRCSFRDYPLSSARAHGFDDVHGGDVAQVAVGDRGGGVAECVADDVDRGVFAGEFGGVGVSEPVGVDATVDVGFAQEAGKQAAHVGGVDAAAAQRAEDGSTGTGGEAPEAIEPAPEERGSLLVDADCAALIALVVADTDRRGRQVHVSQLRRQRLGNS